MSYILDALKRADAERARGAVPGLHDQPLGLSESAPSAARRTLLWLLLLALSALALAAALWVWRSNPPAAKVASAQATAPAPMPAAATSAPSPQAATPSVPAPAPVPAAIPTPPPTPTPTAQPAPTAPPVAAPVVTPTPAAAPAVVPTKPVASAPKAAAVPLLSELGEEFRRQLPALAVSGAVYSANPGQRLLLINGQVLTQGSTVAPDLTLEEIREHSAVFNFRGTQFRLNH